MKSSAYSPAQMVNAAHIAPAPHDYIGICQPITTISCQWQAKCLKIQTFFTKFVVIKTRPKAEYMTRRNYLPAIALVATLAACTSPAQRKSNTEAEAAARNAAEAVIAIDTIEPVDSFALERAILDAKATQSRYDINGNQEASEVFDRTFREVIGSRRPELAKLIFIASDETDNK